jgi:dipeptidyl aminopeptidase/acylaminoacyl peptidase
VSDAPDKPETRDVPKSFWEKVKEKPWTYAGIAASIIVPLIIGTWLLVQSGAGFTSYPGEDDSGVEESRGVEIPESTEATEAVVETETVSVDDTDNDAAEDPAAQDGTIAPFIAYRQEGTLYIAAEDGSSPMPVASSARGAFSLSPDGKMLAWVDGVEGVLHVTTVGGEDVVIGVADDVAPAWEPDSTGLLFSVPSDQGSIVYRVNADGSLPESVRAGHSARFGDDGERVVLIDSAGPGQPGDVVVIDASGKALGGVSDATAIEAVLVGDEIVYSVAAGKDAEEIRVSTLSGSEPRMLVGPARLGVPVVYAQLVPSPDGSVLKYAASGDDGYSRAYVVELTGEPTPLTLSIRRDTYPLRWGADGQRLFIVEGNAFQGEKTSVVRVSGDGIGRTVVVEGGGL